MNLSLSEILSSKHLNACKDKRERYSADRPPTAIDYAAVDDARDLFWLFGALGIERKLIVLAACDCARRPLPRWERLYPEDMRPRRCIEVTEAWCRGEATIEDVSTARSSAAAAAYAADAAAAYAADAAAYAAASAAAYAAYAAADAAACAASAAYAAYAAADAASYAASASASAASSAAAAYAASSSAAAAAYAAADAAACAASAAVHLTMLNELAGIVRLRIPWPVVWTAAVARGLVDAP